MRLAPFLAALLVGTHAFPQKRSYDTHHYYVAELVPDSGACARVEPRDVAAALGAELVERVGSLPHDWLLRNAKQDHLARRSVYGEDPVEKDYVLQRWKALQHPNMKRSCVGPSCVSETCIAARLRSVERQVLSQRHKRTMPLYPAPRAPIPVEGRANRSAAYTERYHISDPLFFKQWHIVNDQKEGNDVHLNNTWDYFTGKGVAVAFIDDGLDYHHPDLKANFFAKGSYDFNDHTPLPEPRLEDDVHGTRCAGEVAAARNEVCGVGVAPNAKIAGIRILSAPISDADEAMALNYAYQDNDIYSCSWGPPDNGKSMDEPKGLVAKALLNGIYNGRGGKGNLFIFAGGNGGASDDQCNFDGYTNSIFTITIAAVDSKGEHPYYSEMCSAIIASSWSSGAGHMIETTDASLGTKRLCTESHGGTSAAAPLVAGMLALALEARPELTWRDAQHLLIQSSDPINTNDPDWSKNGAGLMYSHKYGFGVVRAARLVENAQKMQLVKPQAWFESAKMHIASPILNLNANVTASLDVTQKMLNDANVAKLEHVTVKVWIGHERRGSMKITITSPQNTTSVLASPRRLDENEFGLTGWTFMTLKHWAEPPVGTWTVSVQDHSNERLAAELGSRGTGNFTDWTLMLWGEAHDVSKARPWNFPADSPEYGMTLPGAPTQTMLGSYASDTFQLKKPTNALPDDHHKKPGETSGAFGEQPAADTGYLGGLDNQSVWLSVAAGLGLLVGCTLLLVFLYRRVHARRRNYAYLPGNEEDFALDGMEQDAPLQARDLYDAFALEESDGESDGDGDASDRASMEKNNTSTNDSLLDAPHESR
ncbi:kexin [Malassezia vespertilionis]|nr:kexin [Malassezia vespertilionis]WFD06107.1 kexin [Malassezia vespertilionis]